MAKMVQLQILSKVLATKDITLITNNNLTKEYFLEYEDEYQFILDHFHTYKNVPDVQTFLNQFQDVELFEVTESDRYLIDAIREEYGYSRLVPVIKKSASMVTVDSNEAINYLKSEMSQLLPSYTTPFIDIYHSRERVEIFKDKALNKDKWFIPTGFEELDDIVGGWQRGEEYVVIFARTGQGKSWMLVKVLQHAGDIGLNVGYISPEMSGNKIGYRYDTLSNHFSNKALLKGDTDEINADSYDKYLDELFKRENKFIVSTPRDFGNQVTVSKLKTYVIANKLDILGIDGISYMADERGKRGDNLSTTLKNISEDLMSLSCELNIPILVVVQSNRGGVEKDTPDIEDIRDSDGISFNATKIISLKQKDGDLIMQIKKNRDGKAGDKLSYTWDINLGQFEYKPMADDDFKEPTEEPKPKKTKSKTEEPKQNKRVAF